MAEEHMFTIGEIQEYYDKCGDVERTRARFKKMREMLSAFKEDDERGPPDEMVVDPPKEPPQAAE